LLLEMIDPAQDAACLVLMDRDILIRGGDCLVGLVKKLINGLHPRPLMPRESVQEQRYEVVVIHRQSFFLRSTRYKGRLYGRLELLRLFSEDDSRNTPPPFLSIPAC
jgi:hypothetical protein